MTDKLHSCTNYTSGDVVLKLTSNMNMTLRQGLQISLLLFEAALKLRSVPNIDGKTEIYGQKTLVSRLDGK